MTDAAHRSGGGGLFLVECYWPGVTEERLAAALDRVARAAAEMAREGIPVRYLRSVLIPSDEAVFCLFEGSAESVAEASRRADLPFDRVVGALVVGAASPSPLSP